MIKAALTLFTNLYAFWVIGASILAFFVPEIFLWFTGPWITWALSIIMLGMGLTLKVEDFKRVWEMPRPVALGFCAQYTIMPLTAWTIAQLLRLDTPFAVGLILVACCPGGTASNLVAFLARANIALSVVLTMASTLLAIVMTPFLMEFWAGHYVPVDAWGIFRTTLQVVLVPIVLGVYINHRFPKVGTAAAVTGPAVAVFAIVMIAGSIVASNASTIVEHGVQLATAGFLLHSIGFALGYGITRLFRYNQRTARTISIEVGMQNSGLAMVLAHQHFAAATATPAVFSSVFHTLVGSICAAYWRLRPPTDEGTTAQTGRDRSDIYYWKCDRPAHFHGTRREKDSGHARELIPVLQSHLRKSLSDKALGLELLNAGGDHLTYLAKSGGQRYFVRVQDGPDNDDYMEIVGELSNRVQEEAKVPTARTILADSSRAHVPFAFQVIEYLPYPDLNRLYKERNIPIVRLGERIGADIARWQRIRAEGYGLFDSKAFREERVIRGLHPSYEAYFRLNWDKHLHFLSDHAFLSQRETDSFRRIVDEHASLLQLDGGCLVHKDLALWNILGTEEEVKAYIDWDDVINGDPVDDIALLGCFHDSEFMAAVLEGYQSVRPLPEAFTERFWLHLLRNMVFKAVIRVGSDYFQSGGELFLAPPGGDGKSLEAFTKERLQAAFGGLRDGREVISFSMA
jgi:bile acid:Na+ symporter, BASS family